MAGWAGAFHRTGRARRRSTALWLEAAKQKPDVSQSKTTDPDSMPSLPGNVARYDTVDLLDLDGIELYFDVGFDRLPRTAGKLRETERRRIMFDWATFMIHQPRRNESLFRDFASAFFKSFEAMLQVLRDERAISHFEGWLRAQPTYDAVCRGLRTLRHLEAHAQPGKFNPSHAAKTHSRFSHSATGGTIGWRWEPILPRDLARVTSRNSKLAASELDEWNGQCEEMLALGLMRHGLQALNSLVKSP